MKYDLQSKVSNLVQTDFENLSPSEQELITKKIIEVIIYRIANKIGELDMNTYRLEEILMEDENNRLAVLNKKFDLKKLLDQELENFKKDLQGFINI